MFPQQYTLKNGQQLVIRKAAKNDAAATLICVSKTGGETDFLTFGAEGFPGTVADEEKFIKRCQTTANMLFIVAEVEGQIVGMLAFEGQNRLRLQHSGEFGITLLKDFWARGIGSRLIELMLAWAKSTGIVRKINLRVRQDNQRAITLYQKYGFKQEGLITRDYLINGHFYSVVLLGLAVD